jgi:hypothetical protein
MPQHARHDRREHLARLQLRQLWQLDEGQLSSYTGVQKGRLIATLSGVGQPSVDRSGDFRWGGYARAMATRLLAIAAHFTVRVMPSGPR